MPSEVLQRPNHPLPYDPSSPDSILDYARELLGRSLHRLHPEAQAEAGRGGLGQAVERYHFFYEPNSVDRPDFPAAGVELKCTPLKEDAQGCYASKERLVLNIINYMTEAASRYENSSFRRKNALLLLMFYLHENETLRSDLLFKIIRLWSIPEADEKIFRDDWETIHRKIVEGKAHEISEGDTFYLAACVKGSRGGANKRPQPNSAILADQRAYSIKSSYLNQIVLDSAGHPDMATEDVRVSAAVRTRALDAARRAQSIVRSLREYRAGETFELLVHRKLAPYVGKSVAQIENILGVRVSASAKAMSYDLCRAMFHVSSNRIAEFEKADVLLKTVRLEPNGTLKEAMSFAQIKYADVFKEETWDESEWRRILTHRFLFVVFRKSTTKRDKDAVFESAFFWTMPNRDLESAENFWQDTRDKIRAGDYDHFLRQSEHPTCHVRPKAKNAADMAATPQGGLAKKYCYWLNREYVLSILENAKATTEAEEPPFLPSLAARPKAPAYDPNT